RQRSDGEAVEAPSGVSASLRAAAALSPHRGFYHTSSPQRPLRRAQTTSACLAWAPAAVPMPGDEKPDAPPEATPGGPAAVDACKSAEATDPGASGDAADGAAVPSAPSWKRLERTVTQYVSRRNVTLSEYEQVQQRYEGHMNTLKVLCETVRAPEKEKKIIHRGSRGLNFRDLQEEKDFQDFLELRDPLLGSRAGARPRSCSPRQASPPRSRVQRSSTEKKAEKSRHLSEEALVEEKSVTLPLLGARMLSAVPMALLYQDNDLEHVRSLFCAQVPEARVLEIFRVENATLAGVYSAVREAMGSDCELDLWHGTSSECVPNIVLNGFNRAYSGRRHGTKLGHGSYFSASAAYSTRFCDRKRQRRTVFFAKVLVGAWAKGSPDLVEPPVKDAEGLIRYDSTVDDLLCPVNFCIFRDFQAMPTYLLEFTI
ncbi:Protein mono-ADP-ribosyltransferase PARP10 (ADP-ribosyltransferase diphtheria toxin-like 10) (ARTD10) (Poly [ADP-ribose] polymerase 10) (PARP-10), partial [Durusdinium trenchii]